jgi:hypothetical protein
MNMEAANVIEEQDVFPELSPLVHALAALDEEEDMREEVVEAEPPFERYLATLKESSKKRYRNRVANFESWAAEFNGGIINTLDALYGHMMWLRVEKTYLASTIWSVIIVLSSWLDTVHTTHMYCIVGC